MRDEKEGHTAVHDHPHRHQQQEQSPQSDRNMLLSPNEEESVRCCCCDLANVSVPRRSSFFSVSHATMLKTFSKVCGTGVCFKTVTVLRFAKRSASTHLFEGVFRRRCNSCSSRFLLKLCQRRGHAPGVLLVVDLDLKKGILI
jgi:hypothetical protein